MLKIVSALMVAVMLLCSSPVGSAEYNSVVMSSFAATKKIKLKKTKVTLVTGETYTQKLLNEKGKAITKNVKWSTANKKTATVSSKGKVTAKKAGKGENGGLFRKFKIIWNKLNDDTDNWIEGMSKK